MSRRTAPSWRTIGNMDQARYIKTARMYASDLPPALRRLAESDTCTTDEASALAQWCADTRRPLVRAGHRNT